MMSRTLRLSDGAAVRVIEAGSAGAPVLLIHGDEDQVVPFSDMGKAGDALVAAGFPTYGHVMKGTGHGIAPDGVGMALNFIRNRLGIDG